MKYRLLSLAALLLASCAPQSPVLSRNTSPDGVEHLTIPSVTPAGVLTISRQIQGGMTKVNVTADLYLPAKPASTSIPAMVLAHGSGGIKGGGEKIEAWVKLFNEWGIAALVIDSFTPRGVVEVLSDHSTVPQWANVADAFAGLKALAADPRIDRNRIGVMGFSRGGNVSIMTAYESLRGPMVPGELHFAVHIPLYPACETIFSDKATDKSPMLFLHGEADDQTSATQCREYARWFETMGNPTKFVSYPGAYHDFDQPKVSVSFNPKEEAGLHCDARYDIVAGRYTQIDHKQVAEADGRKYMQSCTTFGSHSGSNPTARSQAISEIHIFLKSHLGAH